jgi:lipoate-protein ligase A
VSPARLQLPGCARKNDALFVFGSTQPLPFVHVYEQTGVEVVHGPSCRPQGEIDTDRCRADGVPVVARRGGGGTVVLSPGMAIVVVVGERPAGDIAAIYRYVQEGICACLGSGPPTPIEQRGTSDLAVGGRKVAGSSLYLPRRPALFCYQASIMVTSDPALIGRYLKYPPREPDYRGGRSHEEFCTTLHDTGWKLSCARTCRLLQRRLADGLRRGRQGGGRQDPSPIGA